MIINDKITEIFCIIDEFDKNFDLELKKDLLPSTDVKKHRNRKASLSDSEIMTILLLFHFGTYRNFKHYYIYFIREHMKCDFPNVISYNGFVELEQRVFFKLVSGFIWHHYEELDRERPIMQLVDEKLHTACSHTGGSYTWNRKHLV